MIRKWLKKIKAAVTQVMRSGLAAVKLLKEVAEILPQLKDIKEMEINTVSRRRLYENVQVIEYHFINDKAQKITDVEFILNEMFLRSKNLMLMNIYFPRAIVEQSFYDEFGDEVEMTEENLQGVLSPLYCKCADIWELEFRDGTVLYRTEFKDGVYLLEEFK